MRPSEHADGEWAGEPVLPRLTGSQLVVGPPSPVAGSWAGAPSAAPDGDGVALAYRLRAPVGGGRGYANVVARSADGVGVEPVAVLERDRFGGESLERPALVRTPAGRWRLYVSVATPGSKHWRVDLLEADDLGGLADAPARTVLPGDRERGVKDPVVVRDGGRWHLWASVHPLGEPGAEDRMSTE